jgi:hypothetical protein
MVDIPWPDRFRTSGSQSEMHADEEKRNTGQEGDLIERRGSKKQ